MPNSCVFDSRKIFSAEQLTTMLQLQNTCLANELKEATEETDKLKKDVEELKLNLSNAQVSVDSFKLEYERKYETQLSTNQALIEVQSDNAIRVMSMVETWTAILGTVLLLAGIVSLVLIKRSKESMYHEVKNQIAEHAKKEFDTDLFVTKRLGEFFSSESGIGIVDSISLKVHEEIMKTFASQATSNEQIIEFKSAFRFPETSAGDKNNEH
ncbi:hypothetical protein [Shewanella algae]|uniref:hypothetical protein n=1 Tax=Shewanella algae TaxID=38313 RepID=UPI0031F5460A